MSLPIATAAPSILNDYLDRLGLKAHKTPIILNFFRADCPWCTSEMPRLADIYRKHTDLKVHFIGVAEHADENAAQVYGTTLNWTFPLVTDPDGELRKAFQVERVPTIVVIDLHGNVIRVFEGATGQLSGIMEQTVFSVAHDTEPPEYDMVGNGCAP